MIHRAGVVHGDLHKGNILVTPEDRVIILDFEGSRMHADPKQMASEMGDVTSWQAMRVGPDAGLSWVWLDQHLRSRPQHLQGKVLW